MNDAVLITQVYKNAVDDFRQMLELVSKRHQTYADKWKMDYLTVVGNVKPEWTLNNGGWAKLELVRQMLAKGYQYVCWIDADAMIVDMDTDLREGCPEGIGMVMHDGPGTPGPHLNVGIMLMQNTPRVCAFVDEWITHYPGTTEFPWYEQGEAHKMAHDPKWAGVVIEIPAKWNSCIAAANQVEDMVIEGFHGGGTGAQRYEQMKAFLSLLEKEGK